MAYDIFVSYSRKDNQQGRVSELVQHIREDYKIFAGEELSCFFDITEIKAMDDWRNRILGGLRESKLLLLILSPAYLASSYCEWEIIEFLKYECSRSVQGQGVAQIYFVEIPGLDTPDFNKQAAAWVERVRRCMHVDLRPWHDAGMDALKDVDFLARLKGLEESLADRLFRLRRAISAPGNLPAHNLRFVGRALEMDRLHKSAGLGQYGVLTVVQGIGGMGKTALSIQYAYAYAAFYPGGRWLISCSARSTLSAAVRSLDSDLGIHFSDEDKFDDTRAAKRVLAEIARRAEEGALTHTGEKHSFEPRALLILDNVDVPALLQSPQLDLLSGYKWLHVIATTRLDPNHIDVDVARSFHLPVDELPEDDGLQLIESYLPQRRFSSKEECDAAREIVRLLRGFTLAVEVVAVCLGEHNGRLACIDLLQRLRQEGVDGIAKQTFGAVRHAEKLVSVTLAPTLESLSEAETLAVTAAALLPSDGVPLRWVRSVVAETYKETGEDSLPGYEDPWLTLINHLIGLRILQVVEWDKDGSTPRLCRMHRVIQSVVKQRAIKELSVINAALMRIVVSRAKYLKEKWYERGNRWEIKLLGTFAFQALDYEVPDTLLIADYAGECLFNWCDYTGAEPLYARTMEIRERVLGVKNRKTLWSINNLASLLSSKGEHERAQQLYARALSICHDFLGLEDADALVFVYNFAQMLSSSGRKAEAALLFRDVLASHNHSFGLEDPEMMEIKSKSLVSLLECEKKYKDVEEYHRMALETSENQFGPESLETLNRVFNLAAILSTRGDYVGAEKLYLRVLDTGDRILEEGHPLILGTLNYLANLMLKKGDYTGAELLYRRVLADRERFLGSEHPSIPETLQGLLDFISTKGRSVELESLDRLLLEASERVLGVNDPNTLGIKNNHAVLLFKKGDYVGAELLFTQALWDCKKFLGSDNPTTLLVIKNLAELNEKINEMGK